MTRYDVIVIGLGGMGAATLDQLARRGVAALGIEQFRVGHDRGSSHGRTRILRRAYFEHPDYVPLVDRSYTIWAELSRESNQSLHQRTGLLIVGRPDDGVVSGVRRAAAVHGFPIENVPTLEAHQRFPGLRIPDEMQVVFEPQGGFLRVESCVRALVARARAHGADVRESEKVRRWEGEKVRRWESDGAGVRVETDRDTYEAAKLVICAGPWTGRLLEDLRLSIDVRRVVVVWFRSSNPAHRIKSGAPVFGYQLEDGFFYGFPVLDDRGMKIGEHSGRSRVSDPTALDRTLHDDDLARLHAFIDRFLPGVTHEVLAHSVCMYSMTPDEHFIVDRHPEFDNVCFAAGFSGHGFKFAPVIGQALADLSMYGKTDLPIGFLALDRPALRRSSN